MLLLFILFLWPKETLLAKALEYRSDKSVINNLHDHLLVENDITQNFVTLKEVGQWDNSQFIPLSFELLDLDHRERWYKLMITNRFEKEQTVFIDQSASFERFAVYVKESSGYSMAQIAETRSIKHSAYKVVLQPGYNEILIQLRSLYLNGYAISLIPEGIYINDLYTRIFYQLFGAAISLGTTIIFLLHFAYRRSLLLLGMLVLQCCLIFLSRYQSILFHINHVFLFPTILTQKDGGLAIDPFIDFTTFYLGIHLILLMIQNCLLYDTKIAQRQMAISTLSTTIVFVITIFLRSHSPFLSYTMVYCYMLSMTLYNMRLARSLDKVQYRFFMFAFSLPLLKIIMEATSFFAKIPFHFATLSLASIGFFVLQTITIGCLIAIRLRREEIYADQLYSNEEAVSSLQTAILSDLETALNAPAIAKHFDIDFYYRSADNAGGDFIGINYHENTECVIAYIGDVTGHGVSSSIVTAIIKGAIDSEEPAIHDQNRDRSFTTYLVRLADQLNELVFNTAGQIKKSSTLCLILFDLKKGLAYCLNAAHQIPIFYGHNMEPYKARPSSMIGMPSFSAGQVARFAFEQGQSIFLYTDGLIESHRAGAAKLKMKKILSILTSTDTAKATRKKIEDLLNDHLQSKKLVDDCSFLVIKREAS